MAIRLSLILSTRVGLGQGPRLKGHSCTCNQNQHIVGHMCQMVPLDIKICVFLKHSIELVLQTHSYNQRSAARLNVLQKCSGVFERACFFSKQWPQLNWVIRQWLEFILTFWAATLSITAREGKCALSRGSSQKRKCGVDAKRIERAKWGYNSTSILGTCTL